MRVIGDRGSLVQSGTRAMLPRTDLYRSPATAFRHAAEGRWWLGARCVERDELMFAEDSDRSNDSAIATCMVCPARRACLAEALEPIPRFLAPGENLGRDSAPWTVVGVWGGTTEESRKGLGPDDVDALMRSSREQAIRYGLCPPWVKDP